MPVVLGQNPQRRQIRLGQIGRLASVCDKLISPIGNSPSSYATWQFLATGRCSTALPGRPEAADMRWTPLAWDPCSSFTRRALIDTIYWGSQCGTDLSADVGNIVVSERLIGRQGQNRFAEPFGDWKLTFATSQ